MSNKTKKLRPVIPSSEFSKAKVFWEEEDERPGWDDVEWDPVMGKWRRPRPKFRMVPYGEEEGTGG